MLKLFLSDKKLNTMLELDKKNSYLLSNESANMH